MTNQQINTKSISRIAAIQVFYQFASLKEEYDINSILIRLKEFYKGSDFKSDHEIDKNNPIKLRPSYIYLEELVKHTNDNLAEIDQIISKYLSNDWNISDLPVLLHALLRVSICELKYFPETPKKVIINEYTDIANDMLDEKEVGFVNSVLHNYTQDIGKIGT